MVIRQQLNGHTNTLLGTDFEIHIIHPLKSITEHGSLEYNIEIDKELYTFNKGSGAFNLYDKHKASDMDV